MIVLALAGPWLALGFLLVMQHLESWLVDSLWADVPGPPWAEDARGGRGDGARAAEPRAARTPYEVSPLG